MFCRLPTANCRVEEDEEKGMTAKVLTDIEKEAGGGLKFPYLPYHFDSSID